MKMVEKVDNLPISLATLVLLAAGCGLFLVAHYMLGQWAESSLMAHDIQHIIIFTAGLGAGSAVTNLLRKK